MYGSGSDTNYAVLCQSEESTAPLSSVFQDAFKEGAATRSAVFRVVDCEATVPSTGRSIGEEFGLDLQRRPTIFVSGPAVGGKPTQIPDKHLKTGTMLTRYLRAKLEKHAARIETTQELRNRCLSKDVCALLLKGGKKAPSHVKDAMQKLLKEYPDVAFAAVDASVLYVMHLEEYLPEYRPDTARFVVLRKVSGGVGAGDSRLITSIAASSAETAVSYGPMSNLIAQVLQNTVPMRNLSSLPQIKTRTKKLEEAERAKRQRKTQQQQRQQQQQQQSDSGAGGSDDVKEERRRERERRRAEHNAAHNVKPKTPEEIAEMERRRRERMEAEAAKWNVAPEDAPPSEDGYGDYYDDGDDLWEDEDDGTTIVEYVDDGDDDEEDVIDLD